LGYSGIDRKWFIIAFIVVSITTLFSVNYYFVSRPRPITGIMWLRSGGIAGLEETLEIEPDGSVTFSSNLLGEKEFSLSESDWINLLSVIDNSGFNGFEALYESKTGVADFFTYSLTVNRGSNTKRVEWVDDWASKSELPDGLKDIEEHMLSVIHGLGSGEIEGTVSDEIGRPVARLLVSILDGSVGFPEIAVITNDNGFYKIGSVPPGVFSVGVHDENGKLIGQGTAFVLGGETSKLDIIVKGRVIYDYYGGLDLYEKGIYVIASDSDPRVLYRRAESENINDFWEMLKRNVTQEASTKDFISVLISRGDYNTGGYLIQIKSHVWLESYPVVCYFNVNFTDPGEGVAVTEALTNPLVLVPIGNLSTGKYVARAHIDSFILTYDSTGKPVFTSIKTLVEEVWDKEFEIS
jgi:hypothetical protein